MVKEERGSNLLPARGRHADCEVRAALGSLPRAGGTGGNSTSGKGIEH